MEPPSAVRQNEVQLAVERDTREHPQPAHVAGCRYRAHCGGWQGCGRKDAAGRRVPRNVYGHHRGHIPERTDARGQSDD